MPGEDLVGKPPGTGQKLIDEFNDKSYHQPSDEYHDDWDFSGMEQYAAIRFADRRERRQLAQVAHLARRRRVSARPPKERRELGVPISRITEIWPSIPELTSALMKS